MISKTVNINTTVTDKNDKLKEVAHMSCNIDSDCSYFNMSVHISDKELYKNNIEELKEKFEEFLKHSLKEAATSGWEMLDVNKSK